MEEEIKWYALTDEEVLKKTASSQKGLNSSESKKRLKTYGENIFQIKNSETIFCILFRQLKNPIVYVLILSGLLAFFLKKNVDGVVVLSVVVLNTIIGFVQEYRAHRIIKALSALMPHKATVLRNGDPKLLPSHYLVPGDVVVLEAGDKVPADIRLFSLKNLQCDESALTGESIPVTKTTEPMPEETPLAERRSMAFGGTYITAGIGVGVVVTTGLKTEFGKITELIETISPLETALSITLKKIARGLTIGVLIMGVFLFIIGYLRGGTIFDSSLAAVALAVAAIPEGLPAALTIASAVGVRRMARNQAIIRQLPAVESLGNTTIICTDKTGTLTHNEMTVQRIWTHSGFSFVTGSGFALEGRIIPEMGLQIQVIEEEVVPLLQKSILCSDARLDESDNGWAPLGDPTEVALVVAGRKAELNETNLRLKWKRDDVIPFEPERKFMATLNTSPDGKRFIFLKGAPEEVLLRCNGNQESKSKWLGKVDEMAKDGMRVLAFAEKEIQELPLYIIKEDDIKDKFVFLGLVGMIDPLRKEVYSAIKSCHEAGIKVKMVTGDHPVTAKAVGLDLGLLTGDQLIVTGHELNRLEADQWRDFSLKYNVFARVAPEHKLKLVMALQEQGHVVAMTGDGVNDAPALKRADIGIAMGIKGTSVAKEASDMILADDNFASIEAAIKEGRRVYDNLIKSLTFILPTSLGQSFIVFIAILFFPVREGVFLHPMQPVQILWVNLIVAVALALPLAFERQEPDIMKRIPKKKSAPVLNKLVIFRTITITLLMSLGTIGLFLWQYHSGILKGIPEEISVSKAQTMSVTAIILFQILYLFRCRYFVSSVFGVGFFSNVHLLIGVLFVLFAQISFVYFPVMNHFFHSSSLDLMSWGISLAVSVTIFSFVILNNFLKNVQHLDQ